MADFEKLRSISQIKGRQRPDVIDVPLSCTSSPIIPSHSRLELGFKVVFEFGYGQTKIANGRPSFLSTFDSLIETTSAKRKIKLFFRLACL